MKIIGVIVVATLLGAFLGVAVAHLEVGQVEHDFAPTSYQSSGVEAGAPMSGVRQAIPQVEIKETTFEFGVMQRGATMSHEFIFHNKGDADLWLEVGSTSCKCTAGTTNEAPIKPGESAPVRVEWTAKVVAGPFQQRAVVHTNDPRTSRIELSITGQVVERSGLKPGEFLLGKMSAEKQQNASVYLASFVSEGLEASATMAQGTTKPELYELSVQSVPVEELPFEGAKSGVRIDLTVGPGLPIGHLTEWIEIETNQEEIGEILVAAVGAVEGDITLHGRGWSKELGLLNLGNVSGKSGIETELIVSVKGEHAEGAQARLGLRNPEWLEVEFGEARTVREGVTHIPMTLRIPPGLPPVIRTESGQGEGDARFQLLTNHPTSPEVEVRVRFIIIE